MIQTQEIREILEKSSLFSLETQLTAEIPENSPLFTRYKREIHRIFAEISTEFAKKLAQLHEISQKLEFEREKSELFEKTQENSQKEAEKLKNSLEELAIRLENDDKRLKLREKELENEVELRSKAQIKEIEAFFFEKQQKLLETMSITDEKAVFQEELVAKLARKLEKAEEMLQKDAISQYFPEKSREITEEARHFAEIARKHASSEQELRDRVETLEKTCDFLEKDRETQRLAADSLKKRWQNERNCLKARVLELEEAVEQKTSALESLQRDFQAQLLEISKTFAGEKEELLQKLRFLEKNDQLFRNPSQSQGFSPLPKELDAKFDGNFLEFRLEPSFLTTPKNRHSWHTKAEKSAVFEETAKENERFVEINRENLGFREELRRNFEEIAFLKRSLEAVREGNQVLQRQFEKAMQDLAKLRNESRQKDAKLSEFVKEIKELQGIREKFAEISRETMKKDAEIAELLEKNRRNTEKLRETEEKVEKLTASCEELRRKCEFSTVKGVFDKVLREKDQIIKESLENLKKYKEKLRSFEENSEKDEKIRALQQEIERISSKTPEFPDKNDKNRLANAVFQRELAEKAKEIQQKNREIEQLSQKLKRISKDLEEERRKSFNPLGSKNAIFIDDPHVKDQEIADLHSILQQKQREIDVLKQNLPESSTTPATRFPGLLQRVMEKKDAELKQLSRKNAELLLNLQTALGKIKELLEKPAITQNTTTNVILNNVRGKSDGLIIDKNWQKLLTENQKLKKEVPKLEHLLMKSRLDAVEERAALQREIKEREEKNVELKVKLAKMAFDKDYYLIKYQEIVKDVERNRGE